MDPLNAAACLLMSLAGAGLGLFSGLAPGIHVNTLASLMLASYPAMESALSSFLPEDTAAIGVCCCIVSASVVHSFLDFVPSVFIGAPDGEDAVSILPAHRLLLRGKGMVAVRAAAVGSLVGAGCAITLAVPLQVVMACGAGPVLDRITPMVVTAAAAVILGDGLRRDGTWALATFLLAGAIGYVSMTTHIPAEGLFGEGTFLFPLLTGLYGMPVLLTSGRGSGMPPQRDPGGDPVGFLPGLRGVLMGTVAGWFPGITATVGATLSAHVFPDSRPETFISTVASVGTVTSVLSFVTLSVSGAGRSGTASVVGEVLGDSVSGILSPAFSALLMSAAAGAVLGYVLTVRTGAAMATLVSRIDPTALNRPVAMLLTALVAMMTGPFGLAVLAASVAIGMVPMSSGTTRAPLCGCLLLPVAVFELSGLAGL